MMGEGPDKNYVRSMTNYDVQYVRHLTLLLPFLCEVNFHVPTIIILLRHSSLFAPTSTDQAAEQPTLHTDTHYVFATRNIITVSTSGIG